MKTPFSKSHIDLVGCHNMIFEFKKLKFIVLKSHSFFFHIIKNEFSKIYCVGYAEDVTLVEYSTLSQGSGHS